MNMKNLQQILYGSEQSFCKSLQKMALKFYPNIYKYD